MEGTKTEVTTEALEAELLPLMRRREFTARAMRLAEEFLAAAERRHVEVDTTYEAVYGELERRYQADAELVGAVPDPANLPTVDGSVVKLED